MGAKYAKDQKSNHTYDAFHGLKITLTEKVVYAQGSREEPITKIKTDSCKME